MLALALALALLSGDASGSPGAGERITAEVQVLETPPVTPGAAGELSLVMLETPDPDLPLALRLTPSEVELVDNRLGWGAVVDPLALQPRMRASFRAPEAPGDYRVEAQIEYSICGPSWCRTKRATLSWTLTVTDLAEQLGE